MPEQTVSVRDQRLNRPYYAVVAELFCERGPVPEGIDVRLVEAVDFSIAVQGLLLEAQLPNRTVRRATSDRKPRKDYLDSRAR